MSKPTPLPWKYDGRFTICIPAEEGEYCFRVKECDAARELLAKAEQP